MNNRLDIHALLKRGGLMTPSEVEQLTRELTEAKLSEMGTGISQRSGDQPVKVMPLSGETPIMIRGYFTQQKWIWLKTPEQMEAILGVYGPFRNGVFVLQFKSPLRPGDYKNRAYTYLPDGKEYKPDPHQTVYRPARAPVPQWQLIGAVQAEVIARLRPGERFGEKNKP